MIFIYFNIIWFIGGLLTGLTSFGGNLFSVPFASLLYSPKESIISGSIIGATISFGLAIIYYKTIRWKDTILLTITSIFGIPLGVMFLKIAGEKLILLVASLGILLFLMLEIISKKIKINNKISILWTIPAGLLSGIMMSSLSMGGPPLVIYCFYSKFNKEEIISTVNMAATLILLVTLPWQYLSGLFSNDTIYLGFWGSLSSIIGIIISVPIVKHIKVYIFRILVLIMLAISSLILILRAI